MNQNFVPAIHRYLNMMKLSGNRRQTETNRAKEIINDLTFCIYVFYTQHICIVIDS